MRRLTIAGVFLLFVIVLAGRSPWERAQGWQLEAGHQTAKVVVMIIGNPLVDNRQSDGSAAHPVDDAINSLIQSWSLPAAEPGQSQGYEVSFHCLSVSPEGYTLGVLGVEGAGGAEEMLSSAQQTLEGALQEVHRLGVGPFIERVKQAQDRVEQAEKLIETQTNELGSLQAAARAEGQTLEPQDPQLLASVRRDNLSLRAELAGLSAQRQAIVGEIAKATDKVDATKDDERLILEGLTQALRLRIQELERLHGLRDAGTVSASEVARAEVAVAQAQAELAERRLTLAQQAGGGQLGRLNERLVETQIAITAAQARLEETQKAIEQLERSSYNPASPLVIAYQRTRRALDGAQAEQEAAAAELARVKMARDAIVAPKVTVIRREADQK
jgi:hypothetical protein